MNISLIPASLLPEVWPKIERYVDGAAKYTFGRFNTEDIKKDLLEKDQQLWIAFDDKGIYGFVVTEVIVYPRTKSLAMHFTGGERLTKWKDKMLKVLQKFASDCGCDIIESHGRKGWEHIFKDDGFKWRFMFYELPVKKE